MLSGLSVPVHLWLLLGAKWLLEEEAFVNSQHLEYLLDIQHFPNLSQERGCSAHLPGAALHYCFSFGGTPVLQVTGTILPFS